MVLFDFNNPENEVLHLPFIGDFDEDNYSPHGISLYENMTSGEMRIFVVNHHKSQQERIEVFRFDEKHSSLHHIKTITGQNIYSVNDLVAVGPETFYYTNDLYFSKLGPIAYQMEMYSGLSLGNIGLYINGKDTILSTGHRFPNGINISPDGKYLYVATLTPGVLLIFSRKEDNSIEDVKRVNLYTAIDNIEVDRESGDLWIGCHPKLHLLMEHERNHSKSAGSQVLRLRFGDQNSPFENIEVREVLMDDGSLIKGSSVASYYDNKMLVGTVANKLAYCEIIAF
ncbi:serum paraoxonase/arylesterase 1-like [Ptychodera flava]|uniref:serum paraoxonase/arylesterase 1-like n=1 Tax=Ptychodera flava TaxID=63121 RepID=UPI003969D885